MKSSKKEPQKKPQKERNKPSETVVDGRDKGGKFTKGNEAAFKADFEK